MLHTMTSAAFVRSPSVLRDGFWSAFVAERERWVLWLPVALGIGIAVYFALPRELVWFSGPVLLAVSLAGLITVRRGSLVRLTMVLVLFSGAGFSAAQCARTRWRNPSSPKRKSRQHWKAAWSPWNLPRVAPVWFWTE